MYDGGAAAATAGAGAEEVGAAGAEVAIVDGRAVEDDGDDES